MLSLEAVMTDTIASVRARQGWIAAANLAALILWSGRIPGAPQATTGPPEIVALTSAQEGFHPRFEEVGLAPETVDLMKRFTWREGCPVPLSALTTLRLSYWDFEGRPQNGELIVNREVAKDVEAIFRRLFGHGFLIESMKPVEEYQGSDDASMAANNTSGFNCRDVTGHPGKFSNHSWGRAIDVNPRTNPMILKGRPLPPAGAAFRDRSKASEGSILAGSFIVRLFQSRGWRWGGEWSNPDYQHFEKEEMRTGYAAGTLSDSLEVSVDPRYPIGRYQAPASITHQIRHEWITAIAILPRQLHELVRDMSEAQLDSPYREGGWTVRQVVHHLADSHVNASLRFRFALTENEPTVKAYDEAAWAKLADARTMPVNVSLDLLTALHARWVALLRSMTDADFERAFVHPELGRKTLNEVTGLYAWHGRHHLAHVRLVRGLTATA